jgi:hypothetical protein
MVGFSEFSLLLPYVRVRMSKQRFKRSLRTENFRVSQLTIIVVAMKLPTIKQEILARNYGLYFKLYCQTITNYKTVLTLNY